MLVVRAALVFCAHVASPLGISIVDAEGTAALWPRQLPRLAVIHLQ